MMMKSSKGSGAITQETSSMTSHDRMETSLEMFVHLPEKRVFSYVLPE